MYTWLFRLCSKRNHGGLKPTTKESHICEFVLGARMSQPPGFTSTSLKSTGFQWRGCCARQTCKSRGRAAGAFQHVRQRLLFSALVAASPAQLDAPVEKRLPGRSEQRSAHKCVEASHYHFRTSDRNADAFHLAPAACVVAFQRGSFKQYNYHNVSHTHKVPLRRGVCYSEPSHPARLAWAITSKD